MVKGGWILFFFLAVPIWAESVRVGDWYEVAPIRPNVFAVTEPTHVTFYVLRYGNQAVFIDSGLGLDEKAARALFNYLNVTTFDVLLTHAHPDHVGLNHFAKSVHLSKTEWDRHRRLSEQMNNIGYYYEAFSAEAGTQWPPGLTLPPAQSFWVPSHFLEAGKTLTIGPWTFLVVSSPGHTAGHLSFYETTKDLYLTGDLVYDGTLYQQMQDSSLSSLRASLTALQKHLASSGEGLLLPSHNTIPLSPDHVGACLATLSKIETQTLAPASSWKAPNALFLDGRVFEDGMVRINVRNDDPMLGGGR